MANYVLQARSNYFRVKDPKRFERWCRYFGLTFWTDEKLIDSSDLFYAIAADNDCGWPSHHPDADISFDFEAQLRNHLDPRDVAVLIQTGAEGLRFILGCASAIHSDGRGIFITLGSIYDRARETFGDGLTITEAEY